MCVTTLPGDHMAILVFVHHLYFSVVVHTLKVTFLARDTCNALSFVQSNEKLYLLAIVLMAHESVTTVFLNKETSFHLTVKRSFEEGEGELQTKKNC